MSWNDRIIGDAELQPYLKKAAPDFRARSQALIAQQVDAWPMLRAAVVGLAEVESKKLSVKGSEVFAQFNPDRIVSTAARVDAATIDQRPCFLCVENLPPQEKGIAFGFDFVELCNPFPVLKNHLVIAARRHTPQIIEGNFGILLDLAKELGDEWFALYNGPKCGASAPDHLHFQACSRELPPIIHDIERWDRRAIIETKTIEAFTLRNYRINLLTVRGRDRGELIDWFDFALHHLTETTDASAEPMINLIATCDDGRWTVIVFPRGKHRPSRYDAEGDAKLMVSPAAIDLAGVLVVPQQEHFARITGPDVEQVYAEVTLNNSQFESWIKCLEY